MDSGLNPDSKRLIHDLLADAEEHGLVLFVGAGINAKFLALWRELLTDLLTGAIREAAFEDPRADGLLDRLTDWCTTEFDVLAQASIVKHILGAERFRLEIQKALYRKQPSAHQNVKEYCCRRRAGAAEVNPDLEFLWRVADLCSLPQVKAVATFNFDTLLEHAIRACGAREPRAYVGQVATINKQPPAMKDLPVFYIHGLLSPAETLLRGPREPVVLCYDEYFDKNADPLSWETSSSLHLLRNYCTLWLGTSLRDWNMLRLLHAARSGHREGHSYCLQCLQEVRGLPAEAKEEQKRFQQVAMRLKATMFDAVGMRLVIAGDEFASVPRILAEQITEPLRQNGKNHASY